MLNNSPKICPKNFLCWLTRSLSHQVGAARVSLEGGTETWESETAGMEKEQEGRVDCRSRSSSSVVPDDKRAEGSKAGDLSGFHDGETTEHFFSLI